MEKQKTLTIAQLWTWLCILGIIILILAIALSYYVYQHDVLNYKLQNMTQHCIFSTNNGGENAWNYSSMIN